MKKKIKFFSKYKYLIIFFILIIIIVIFVFIKSFNSLVKSGIKNNIIIFGQSASLTKKNFILGREYSLGYYLAFNKYNNENKKYKIKLLIYDDEYNKEITKKNIELLDNMNGIFAVLGTVGTPTSVNIMDYVIDKNIPLLQPLTGSNILRKHYNKNIIHTRPSYYDELKLIISFIIKNKKKNISILYQNDNFGFSIINDINYLLTKKNYINKINIISTSAYNSTDLILNKNFSELLNIKNPYNINEITKSKFLKNIDSLIILSGSQHAIQAIKYFKINKPSLFIFTISFTEIFYLRDNIKKLNSNYLNNIYSTEVILINNDNQEKLLNDLKKAKKKLFNNIKNDDKSFYDYITILKNNKFPPTLIEGYINGLFITYIIDQIKDNITRESFINEIYKIKNLNIFGYKFGPYKSINECSKVTNNCPCDVGLNKVYLYKYNISKKEYLLINDNYINTKCKRY